MELTIDIFLYISVFTLIFSGLAGCIIPGMPGPPLAFIGYLLLLFTPSSGGVTWWSMLILGLMTAFTVIADFVVPMLGVKTLGGTKWGNWGCLIGSIVGLFYSPLGIIVGPFIGAMVFELIGGMGFVPAAKSALGSTLGFIVGTGLKIIITIVILIAAIIALFF